MPRRAIFSAAAGLAALPSFSMGKLMEKFMEKPASCGSITDVGGLQVGHFTEKRRPTGCTVMLFDEDAVVGVDVRGAAPGTRETDLLNPLNSVQRVNAILLSGGSAFGLDAATGVMRYLEEHGRGFHVAGSVVPIVPAAVLFDLPVGDGKIRPNAESGYLACVAASRSVPAEGNVGAGAGATVGKLFGMQSAMKCGFGTVSISIGKSGLIVGAMVAVNALGDVLDHETGHILAGARAAHGGFRNTLAEMIKGVTVAPPIAGNTTLGIVATNAAFTKTQATKIAQMAHDGLARTINPIHTGADGDTIFCAATGTSKVATDITTIGAIAAEAIARAVNRATRMATSIPGLPAERDWRS